jgi:hypothetical protein
VIGAATSNFVPVTKNICERPLLIIADILKEDNPSADGEKYWQIG